jgi:glycosyltransferase involved in cell wall biosynthesis
MCAETKETAVSESDFDKQSSIAALRHAEKEPPMSLRPDLKVALLTGGQDRHYACGLAMALVSADVSLDVVGSDSVDGPEMHGNPRLRFFNLHGSRQKAPLTRRIRRILAFYLRLTRYAWNAKPRIFHILWNNKIQLFDRTLLMLYYKLLGKKVVLTAHNVNDGRRDGKDSLLNRLTLQCQYRLADHMFVHTEKMKKELLEQFHVSAAAVTIIPFGINNAVPDTSLTSAEAKQRLGLRNGEKTLLFFGAIKPYKGLEYLVAAFQALAPVQPDIRLIIAGERKKGHEQYWSAIQQRIDSDPSRDKVIQKIGFIPDDETELYFKAADVAVLPYTEIFQSGILFLAYSFGLPVIATDVGSFAEDIIEGKTGYICKQRDPDALAEAIQNYFNGALFRELEHRREEIREHTRSRHSWTEVGSITRQVYADLLAGPRCRIYGTGEHKQE